MQTFSSVLHRFLITLIAIFFIVQANSAEATVESRAIGNENRIRVINYRPNSVIKFIGHYLYHSIIEFSPDEEIKSITMGTPTAWQILPEGNRIFIKPIEEEATTNMIVITSKRMYFFEMHAEYAEGIQDPNLAFITKFIYPVSVGGGTGAAAVISSSTAPDLAKPGEYNFRYKVSGPAKQIEPLLIFDDGEFTYFRFRDMNAETPAIFMVDAEGGEAIVNYRIFAGYVVVERVTDRFTLRQGRNVICVFNEAYDKKTWGNFDNSVARGLMQNPESAPILKQDSSVGLQPNPNLNSNPETGQIATGQKTQATPSLELDKKVVVQ